MPNQRLAQLFEEAAHPKPPIPQEDVFSALGYVPTPKQWEFHRATEYDVLYGGAAGGGKSKAIVMHALWAAVAYPGIRVIVFRRTFDELAESIIPELASVGFGEALGFTWNGSASELRRGKSVVRLRYLETLVDASRRQGGQYQLLCLDERTLFPPGAVDLVMERVRTKVESRIPVLGIRSTSNPGGSSHSEVKTRFIDSTKHGEQVVTDAHGHTIRFIPARVDDNPHIDPGYRARLEAIPDAARRAAMLDGSWDSFSGQVFTEWNRDKHVVQPFPLSEDWPRYMAVDWGYTNPWAVVWGAEDEDGRVWIYRELYAKEVGEHEQARRIKEAEEGDPSCYRVGDPAMAAQRGDAESITSAYATEGVGLQPANNDRLAGWARVHSYLADGPACPHHRAQGLASCPKLHVFANCENLIRTLPALPYSATKPEDVDTHAEDHVADALRYLCMALGTRASFVFTEPTASQPKEIGPYVVIEGEEGGSWVF